jgi:SAM-dependent methyltransferase
MKKIVTLKIFFNLLGFDRRLFSTNMKNLPRFFRDMSAIKKQLRSDKDFPISLYYPILKDRKDSGGTASGHYFHQDLLVAQKIFLNKPDRHVDIASRVDGFVAHVASFREIEIFDIRPIDSIVTNIRFVQSDLMQLNETYLDYTDSISCLHAIEHFGLGRYGDPIDSKGHIKGIENITRMLKKGGKFYFSTPIGPQRIEFNAHRVFSLKYLLALFKDKYELQTFSYVNEKGDLYPNVILTDETIANNFNCQLGCGIFEFIKK